MRIAQVIGTVTLSRAHPTFKGCRLRLVIPLSMANLEGKTVPDSDPLVAFDELGIGDGSRIAISEGREAAQPFGKDVKPVDVYAAAILDQIHVASKSK